MLMAWAQKTGEFCIITEKNHDLLNNAIWIDLVSPSKIEESWVETHLGFNIPTRDEMQEIEVSSRLYKENDVFFMTALMIAHADSENPECEAVTFILTKNQLITLRYIEPETFKLFASNLANNQQDINAMELLTNLLDSVIDRLADILECLAMNLNNYSKKIFRPQDKKKFNYIHFLQHIGQNADLNAKVEESLLTFGRLVNFLEKSGNGDAPSLQIRTNLSILDKDIESLTTQTGFIGDKMTFLLDATLGLIHIEQNSIIKIFSVAAVIFLPPTLIASIYGMNFRIMPELSWKYGYFMAIGLMLLAAWLPYRYFKYRKWL